MIERAALKLGEASEIEMFGGQQFFALTLTSAPLPLDQNE